MVMVMVMGGDSINGEMEEERWIDGSGIQGKRKPTASHSIDGPTNEEIGWQNPQNPPWPTKLWLVEGRALRGGVMSQFHHTAYRGLRRRHEH